MTDISLSDPTIGRTKNLSSPPSTLTPLNLLRNAIVLFPLMFDAVPTNTSTTSSIAKRKSLLTAKNSCLSPPHFVIPFPPTIFKATKNENKAGTRIFQLPLSCLAYRYTYNLSTCQYLRDNCTCVQSCPLRNATIVHRCVMLPNISHTILQHFHTRTNDKSWMKETICMSPRHLQKFAR